MLSPEVQQQLQKIQQSGAKVILASGVFDILHQEHKNFLAKAKSQGDVLVVTIESDVRVRAMKGEGRPVNAQDVRKANLVQLNIADIVIILPEEFNKPEHFRQLLLEIHPNVLAVSSHTAHLDKKQQLMAELGGEVQIVHQLNPDISTTQILESRRLNKTVSND